MVTSLFRGDCYRFGFMEAGQSDRMGTKDGQVIELPKARLQYQEPMVQDQEKSYIVCQLFLG